MTFEEKGNGTTIRLVETVYLYLIQIDFDSKVTEFFHNDLGLRNVGEFVWTESLGRSLGAMEGGCFWDTERGLVDVVEALDAKVQVARGLGES
jgi:hypothetical protein